MQGHPHPTNFFHRLFHTHFAHNIRHRLPSLPQHIKPHLPSRTKLRLRAALLVFLSLLLVAQPALALNTDLFTQNYIIGYDPDEDLSDRVCYSGGTTLSGDGNIGKIINYFAGNNQYGISIGASGIAAILGNFKNESGFSAFKNEVGGDGYGIAQFTPRSKVLPSLQSDTRTAGYFNDYYKTEYGGSTDSSGVPEGVPIKVNDAWLTVQLDYLVSSELTTTLTGTYRNLNGIMGLDYIPNNTTIIEGLDLARTPEDAARYFMWIYERPRADLRESQSIARGQAAAEYLPIVESALSNSGIVNRNSTETEDENTDEEAETATDESETDTTTDEDTLVSVTGDNVTMIGDSITNGSQEELRTAIPGIDIYSQVSKQFYYGTTDNPSGRTILEELIAQNKLRDILVFALGTNNESLTAEQAQEIVNMAGSDRRVIFVTNIKPSSDYIGNNTVFAKMENDNENVSIADWKAAVENDMDKYIGDQYGHPTDPAGQDLFANVIAKAIGLSNSSENNVVKCSYYGSGGGTVGEEGLTLEQAKRFVINYGANINGDSKAVVGDHWNYCGGGGSNCATFSHFFVSKFTDTVYGGGNGRAVADNLASHGATVDTTPAVFTVFSTATSSEYGHTAVVLGHHNGKWIVGHASCSRGKSGIRGAGDGTHEGSGSAWVWEESSDNPLDWHWTSGWVKFAHFDNVNVSKIEDYINNGP